MMLQAAIYTDTIGQAWGHALPRFAEKGACTLRRTPPGLPSPSSPMFMLTRPAIGLTVGDLRNPPREMSMNVETKEPVDQAAMKAKLPMPPKFASPAEERLHFSAIEQCLFRQQPAHSNRFVPSGR